jgi:hypothetical protein
MALGTELSINLASFSFAKTPISINIAPLPSPLLVQVTGIHSMHDQVVLSTGDLTLSKGNIATIGYVFMRNLDITNTILVGPDGTTFQIALRAGEYGLFRWNAAAIHAKSGLGTPSLEYMLIED